MVQTLVHSPHTWPGPTRPYFHTSVLLLLVLACLLLLLLLRGYTSWYTSIVVDAKNVKKLRFEAAMLCLLGSFTPFPPLSFYLQELSVLVHLGVLSLDHVAIILFLSLFLLFSFWFSYTRTLLIFSPPFVSRFLSLCLFCNPWMSLLRLFCLALVRRISSSSSSSSCRLSAVEHLLARIHVGVELVDFKPSPYWMLNRYVGNQKEKERKREAMARRNSLYTFRGLCGSLLKCHLGRCNAAVPHCSCIVPYVYLLGYTHVVKDLVHCTQNPRGSEGFWQIFKYS